MGRSVLLVMRARHRVSCLLHDSIGADSEEAILVGVAAGVHPFVLPGDEVRAAFDMNDSDRAFGQDQFEAG